MTQQLIDAAGPPSDFTPGSATTTVTTTSTTTSTSTTTAAGPDTPHEGARQFARAIYENRHFRPFMSDKRLRRNIKKDPWKLSIRSTLAQYLEKVNRFQYANFKVHGRILYSSSLLLRAQSTHVITESRDAREEILALEENEEEVEEVGGDGAVVGDGEEAREETLVSPDDAGVELGQFLPLEGDFRAPAGAGVIPANNVLESGGGLPASVPAGTLGADLDLWVPGLGYWDDDYYVFTGDVGLRADDFQIGEHGAVPGVRAPWEGTPETLADFRDQCAARQALESAVDQYEVLVQKSLAASRAQALKRLVGTTHSGKPVLKSPRAFPYRKVTLAELGKALREVVTAQEETRVEQARTTARAADPGPVELPVLPENFLQKAEEERARTEALQQTLFARVQELAVEEPVSFLDLVTDATAMGVVRAVLALLYLCNQKKVDLYQDASPDTPNATVYVAPAGRFDLSAPTEA